MNVQIISCDIKCPELALRSTPPIAYLRYGAHRQLFTCFTDHTANRLFAKRSTPPIVYMCYGGIEVIEVCQPEDD